MNCSDLVLLAMGFIGPVKNGLLDSLGVKYDQRGAVSVDEHFMTNLDGVFAGGAPPNAAPRSSSRPLPKGARWRRGLISICAPASLPNQAAENGLQLRSHFAQTLNVPKKVRIGLSLAAALLEDRFERPEEASLVDNVLFGK